MELFWVFCLLLSVSQSTASLMSNESPQSTTTFISSMQRSPSTGKTLSHKVGQKRKHVQQPICERFQGHSVPHAELRDAEMITDWTGRVALVTGASSGMGRAIAKLLWRKWKMKLVVCARRVDRLQTLADEEGIPASNFLPLKVDLGSTDEVINMFNTIREHPGFGGVEVLVNNAGFGNDSPILSGQTSEWQAMLDVNVMAQAVCIREAVADMKRLRIGGHIFSILGMSAHGVFPGYSFYCATKWAGRAIIEGLQQELRASRSTIRVTQISPGLVDTGFQDNMFGDGSSKKMKDEADFKMLSPNDVAESVAHALSCPPHMDVTEILIRPTQQKAFGCAQDEKNEAADSQTQKSSLDDTAKDDTSKDDTAKNNLLPFATETKIGPVK